MCVCGVCVGREVSVGSVSEWGVGVGVSVWGKGLVVSEHMS